MKALLVGITLLSSMAAFAGYACHPKAMIKYMSQGYSRDAAGSMASNDCSSGEPVNQEYYKLFYKYMNMGYSRDMAASMASAETITDSTPSNYYELIAKYMGQGYSRDIAIQKAYAEAYN